MIYRKASPQPARLLLRIVATASALAAVAACSSSSSGGDNTQKDSGAESGPCGNGVCGSVPDSDAGGGLACGGGGPCGAVDAGGGFVCNGLCDGGGDVIVPEESSTFDGPVGVIPIDAGSDH